jgi:hypothetical protein
MAGLAVADAANWAMAEAGGPDPGRDRSDQMFRLLEMPRRGRGEEARGFGLRRLGEVEAKIQTRLGPTKSVF